MTHRDNLPVKLGMLHRPRLHSLIDNGLRQPLLVLLAGPGYGKTQTMADYLMNSDSQALWIRLVGLDNLHTHFWAHFIQALRREHAKLSEQLQLLEFPDTASTFDAFIRLVEADIRGRKRVIWVFDDFGEITDQRIKRFFGMLVAMELENLRLVLISNVLTSTESIAFLTSKRFLVSGKDLQFTTDEISEIYQMYDTALEPDDLREIERYTEGWPLPLHLLALQQNRISALVSQDGRLNHHVISHMFEERFFSSYLKVQQTLVVQLSLLHSFTKELAIDLYEGDKVDLEALGNHVFIANEPTTGRFFFHHLYRLFLKKKEYLLSEGEKRQVWQRAAEYYAAVGDTIDAITYYSKCGNHAGMLDVIREFVITQYSVTAEDAAFILEHLDLLSLEERREYPVADYMRALIYIKTLHLDMAEALLLDLTQRMPADDDARALLGDIYASLAGIHMMRNQEDFGDYYKMACEYLPEGTVFHNKKMLSARNNHSFSMADNLPGARERMESAVHYGVPWMNRFLAGAMSGMEHIFSAEAAYLSYQFSDAQQHAYRCIYKATANAQHDLVCNGHCILARIGLMQGDLAEMSGQIQSITEYAEKYGIGVIREIRDTALGWYYIKLRDYRYVPRSIIAPGYLERPLLAQDRSQIVYANYLINKGEYARMVGMLEHPKGLYVTRGIWPDRICLFIMLAIAHHHLGNESAAMKALWTAYDMTYHNHLTTLFIEAESHMRLLIDAARQQEEYRFDPEWLDMIYRRVNIFNKRVTMVRTDYQKKNPVKVAPDNPLTKREAEILQALSQGLTREEIAAEYYITVNTVKSFIRSIYGKLNAANRAEAVSIALSLGFIDTYMPE